MDTTAQQESAGAIDAATEIEKAMEAANEEAKAMADSIKMVAELEVRGALGGGRSIDNLDFSATLSRLANPYAPGIHLGVGAAEC